MPSTKNEAYHPCPCCGFMTFDEPPGSYAICTLCGWEDDHVQLAHPTMRGGANGGSLAECQLDTLKELPLELTTKNGFSRDPFWRPLEQKDLVPPSGPRSGIEYFQSALVEEPTYYWKAKA